MHRRKFLKSAAVAATPPLPAAQPVRFGIDLFSIRSQGWTPIQYLDYCAKWKAKVVHFSEIRFIGNLEEANLRQVRAHAEKLAIEIEIGMRSICPSSKMFEPAQGTAEEQLSHMIHAAKMVGSPIVRAVLGSMADRTGPVPIEGHIENTVKVLRNVRSLAADNGLKIAIENHVERLHGFGDFLGEAFADCGCSVDHRRDSSHRSPASRATSRIVYLGIRDVILLPQVFEMIRSVAPRATTRITDPDAKLYWTRAMSADKAAYRGPVSPRPKPMQLERVL